MQLVADRFAITDHGRVVDLSSGAPVIFTTSTAGGPSEQARWALRCDRFFSLRHRAIARLVDYGVMGEARRFEAWRSDGVWSGRSAQAAQALEAARLFFDASGLTGFSGVSHYAQILCGIGGRPVVLPDDACGYERERPDDGLAIATRGACGLSVVARREELTLAELVGEESPAARVVAMWGPAGAGLRTAIQNLARLARIGGLIPVLSSLVDSPMVELVDGRSLFLISSGAAELRRRHLLEWALRNPRAHVALLTGETELPGVQGVALRPLPAALLMDAVRPRHVDAATRKWIERAAERAKGLPGRFAALLWEAAGEPRVVTPPRRSTSLRAAEQVAEYGSEIAQTAGKPLPASSGQPRGWPAPGELASLRRRMDAALRQLCIGRWAAGDRLLRQMVGALARRHDWIPAARGSAALAAALLKRGRPQDAHVVLSAAKEYASQAGDTETLQKIAELVGVAWTDLGRLDEAVSVLRTLAAPIGDRAGGVPRDGRLALARCLFWRGEFAEAHRIVIGLEAGRASDVTSVRAAMLASRAAVGLNDLGCAMSCAAAAVEATKVMNDPALAAAAAYAAAFVHLSIGDHDAVQRDVTQCTRAARAARDPVRALKARLVAAEAARRSGREGVATTLLRRVRTLSTTHLPATVRARCNLLNDLLSSSAADAVVKRHVAGTGLAALSLFGPPSACDGGRHGMSQLAVDDSVEVLRCCQAAEDEAAVLAEVCARLRTRLNAAAMTFFGPDSTAPPLVTDGRIDAGIAGRIIAAGQTIAPYAQNDRIEGGAPVRYGGQTIGALAGRWMLGASYDPSRAAMAMTMAATAAGPAMAVVLARREQGTAVHTDDLAGVSAAIEEVRRAVERAAAAPFAVLVQGESGSGKELVARALHRRSPRRTRPFCVVNCAALPDDLVEAELFGHSRGAFTGAIAERAGVFEEAHTGTLFLDEVGELSARAQAKVLRAIQEGEIRRVGENVPRRIDVRVVSATNRDLGQEVAAGRFRLDLLYRLDVIRISVPPLRDRREDIAVLAERCWREATERVGSRAAIGAPTVAALARYDWPGNVRELQNVLAALAVRSPKRGVVPPTALPAIFGVAETGATWRLDAARRSFEERFVRAALVRTGGHRVRAAGELGLTRQGLTKLMTRLGIAEP